MFVRKKKNKSGKISVQVVDKSSGKYRVMKTFGCSDNVDLVEDYFQQAKRWIDDHIGNIEIDFNDYDALEDLPVFVQRLI